MNKTSRRRLNEEVDDDDSDVSPPKSSKPSQIKSTLLDKFRSKRGSLSRFSGDAAPLIDAKVEPKSDDDEGVGSAAEVAATSSGADNVIEIKPEPAQPRLSDAQRAKIERNRQRALLLKQARLAKMPTLPNGSAESGFSGAKIAEKISRIVDSGGGFLIEEEEGGEEEDESSQELKKKPGAILQDHLPTDDKIRCSECGKPFVDSFLLEHFDCHVCDACRDNEDAHRLITKTDSKNEYLLKDEDFDVREPPLRFILRKNPHNSRWGDMKLFLHSQVYDRAMEVHGSEEALESKHDQRDEARQKTRQKKFDKKVKELRRKVRSSLFTKDLGPHQHEYGEEEYDEDADEYRKTCKTCHHVLTYEKM